MYSTSENNLNVKAPSVYLLFGTPGSGRNEVLLDLLDGGLGKDETVAVFLPEGETFESLREGGLSGVRFINYTLSDCTIVAGAGEGPVDQAVDTVMIVAPGCAHPADVAEGLKQYLGESERVLARILTVVDCARVSEHKALRTWVEACIHFSDVVLLNRREQVANQWMKDFEEHFRRECFPCRFFLVKKGRLRNPSEVLDPEARRISLFFDELEPIKEDDLEEDERPSDLAEDPYIARLINGQRAKPIPEIRAFFS